MSEPGLELLSGHREHERNVSAMSEAEWDATSDDPKAGKHDTTVSTTRYADSLD
jgi:hypothetical protein